MRKLILIAGLALISVAAYLWSQRGLTTAPRATAPAGNALVAITLPENLSPNARLGKTVFEAKCASCHGENAIGKDGVGPPLVHKIYEPSHHGDEAFQRAVALGVRGHHWRFGDMAPVDGLTRADVNMIVVYIRELQRTNGIN